MNHEDNNRPEGDPTIQPELEARIVAWIMREASADEAAELERMCAEKPGLASFRRRIETVHGLVGEATRAPVTSGADDLRLSPERRRALLEVIGEEQKAEPVPTVGGPTKHPSLVIAAETRRRQRWERFWTLGAAAACVAVVGVIGIGWYLSSWRRPASPSSELAAMNPTGSSHGAIAQPQGTAPAGPRPGALQPDSSMPPTRPGYEWVPLEIVLAQKEIAPASSSAEMAMVPPEMAGGFPARNAPAALVGDLGGRSTVEVTEGFLRDTGMVDASGLLSGGKRASEKRATNRFSGTLAYEPGAERAGLRFGLGMPAGGASQLQDESFLREADQIEARLAQSEVELRQVRASTGLAAPVPGVGALVSRLEREQAVQLSRANVINSSWDASSFDDARLIPAPHWASSEQDAAYLSVFQGREGIARSSRGDASMATVSGRVATTMERAGTAHGSEVATSSGLVSTLSLHRSDVSFRLARAALARGEWPDVSKVRPEEFYNAFGSDDPAPAGSESIACGIDQSMYPTAGGSLLVRIAVRAPATEATAGLPLRLTVLLDTSGSMDRDDRAASVRATMTALGSVLQPRDQVTLIGFGKELRVLADRLEGDQAARLADLAAGAATEGGADFERALQRARELASRSLDASAQSRIVLITDGAANLGGADAARLEELVESIRQDGIRFDACGVGTDILDDEILEALTRRGGGRYCLLESPTEAKKALATHLARMFRPAVRDVTMQVRFNAARVVRHRLIGFEKRGLDEGVTRDDAVAASELAPAEEAVALYQIDVRPEGEGALGEVFLRFRDAVSMTLAERSLTMACDGQVLPFERAAPSMQLAGLSALLAEGLRLGPDASRSHWQVLAPIVESLCSRFPDVPEVRALAAMFEEARRLSNR